MSKYNFDELVERRGTGCVKWDEKPGVELNPALDLIPLWVADMDFKAAPAILEAVRKRAEHGVFGYTVVEEDYYEAVALESCVKGRDIPGGPAQAQTLKVIEINKKWLEENK